MLSLISLAAAAVKNVTNYTMSNLPCLNMEVIGGPCVLIVMDGSGKDYGKDLQLS